MKMKLSTTISIIALIVSIFAFFYKGNSKKVAYVRSAELVYGYLGMQEAHRELEQKSKMWKANIDTLQRDFQVSLSNYNTKVNSLSPEEKKQHEKALMQQQENLLGYSKAIDAQAKEEDEKVTEGVLNQINSFIAEYGEQNGYDVILGTTLSGSLLYGDDAIDITEEVLDALNKNYKGESTNEN